MELNRSAAIHKLLVMHILCMLPQLARAMRLRYANGILEKSAEFEECTEGFDCTRIKM